MKKLPSALFPIALATVSSLILVSCGGQAGGVGGGGFGSIGSVSFDVVGTAQTPVNRTSGAVSFSGVAGASIAGIRYNDYNTQPLIFTSDEDGLPRLFGMTQTSALRNYLLLSPQYTEAQANPYPFPNGQSYAFSALNSSGKWQLKRGFYGSEVSIIGIGTTNAFNNEQPCPAPNGDVYFVSDEDGNREIWKVDIDSNRTRITTTGPGISNENPMISADGNWMVYQSNKDGNNEIYAVSFIAFAEFRLTNNAADDVEPSISPDSLYVTFSSNRSGNYDVYRGLLRTGGVLTQLTTDVNADREPTYSPDGSKIFFTSNRDDTAAPVSTEIYSMTKNGASQTRVPVDSSFNQKSPQIVPMLSPSISNLGFVTVCSGLIASHNNTGLVSLLTFDITSPTDANRGLTRVTSETLPGTAVPVIYYTISTPTSITSIWFNRAGLSLFPQATVVTPATTATNALITYSASSTNAGQVMGVLPYSANRSPIRKRVENGGLVVEGSFPEVFNSKGENIAPRGATIVKFDANGEVVYAR